MPLPQCVIFIFTLIGFVSAAKRRSHRIFEIHAVLDNPMYIWLHAGTPPQQMGGQLDTRSGNLLLMDSDCSTSNKWAHCPALCDDAVLRGAYCSPLCEKVTPPLFLVRCGFLDPFASKNSKTFVQLTGDLRLHYRGYRPFTGRRAKDTISLRTYRFDKAVQLKWRSYKSRRYYKLERTEVEFFRGFSFDTRYLDAATAAFGLAPVAINGKPSFIPHLKTAGVLEVGQFSVQKPVPPAFSSPFTQPDFSARLGALDRQSCIDWRRFPANSQRDWTFEMRDVRFAGRLFPQSHTGRITFDAKYFTIPKEVVDHFLNEGLLRLPRYLPATFQIAVSNRSKLNLEFTAGGQRMHIGVDKMAFPEPSEFTFMLSDEEVRYTDERLWTFGNLFLNYFCFGYDYDLGAVAWAERRRPFPSPEN